MVADCYLKFACSYRMCLCCCVLGLSSFHSFSGFDDEALDNDFYDDLGYGSDIEGILDELCEDDL